jgi:hypothetical protein
MQRSLCLLLALALQAGLVSAQETQSQRSTRADSLTSRASTTRGDTTSRRDSTSRRDTTHAQNPRADTTPAAAVVRYTDGRPVIGATLFITASNAPANSPGRITTTDSLGAFALPELPDGLYKARIAGAGGKRTHEFPMQVSSGKTSDITLPVTNYWPLFWTLLCIGLYAFTILTARWHHIARSVHAMLLRQMTALSLRLETEVEGTTDPQVLQKLNHLRNTVKVLEADFAPDKWGNIRNYKQVGEFLFWSRGRENAAWVALHEIERQLTAFLAPPEYVEATLRWAEPQLRVINSTTTLALADAIAASLQSPDQNPGNDKMRKALLGRAVATIYGDRDTTFSTLMEWHNKASWLIFAALILIAFLAASVGNPVLFLAGAAGGFLSRVMRALKREDVPLDYGASWTTLFLSPLFGALAGWFGIALIKFATTDGLNLLGGAFTVVNWYNPTAPAAIALAFMLGFSERFFDAIVGAVEKHAEGTQAADQVAKANLGAQMALAKAAADKAAADKAAADKAAADEAAGRRAQPKPAVIDKLELPAAQQPIAAVTGKVILDKPAVDDMLVKLTSDNAEFALSPVELGFRKGEPDKPFEVVPKASAKAATVTVTAQAGESKKTAVIQFTA